MNAVPLIISVISLATAAAALAVTWRIVRAERRRSAARVAALAVAADAGEERRSTPGSSGTVRVGWRRGADGDWEWGALGAEDERDAEGAEADVPRDDAGRELVIRSEKKSQALSASGELFDVASRPEGGVPRLGLALGIGVLVVGAAAAFVVAISRNGGERQAAVTSAIHASAPAAAPLELVALRHQQDATSLTISGMVRNPAAGRPIEQLTVVILLLDRNGAPISSQDVPVDYRALAPGEESPFAVTLTDPGSVGRYRVSFHTGSDVVPHVDRRGKMTLATHSL